MSQDVESLESQLEEKDALVCALTERLEEAAEQLDRMHRTGADRGLKMAGGVPVEFLEQQKSVTDDLRTFVEQWEEMQLAASMGRVEMQLTELRDLMAGKAIDSPGFGLAGGTESNDADESEATDPEGSAWEAMKADLMGGEEQPAEGEESVAPSAPSFDATDLPETLEETEHVDPPPPIDFEEAETDDLKGGIEARDAYISYLLKRVRILETHRTPRIDWATLESAPEDLTAKLQEVETQLEERLRLAEVESSLERARLGREEARLRMLEERACRQLKKMGVNLNEDNEEEEDEEEEKSGRWMRMLGLKRENDE